MSSWYMRRSSALPQRRTPYATARSLKRDSDLPNVSSARVPFLDRLLHLVLAAAGEPRVLRVPHDVGHATCPERGVELLLVDHRGHLARPGREARALHGAQVIPGNQVHREAAGDRVDPALERMVERVDRVLAHHSPHQGLGHGLALVA